MNDPSAPWRLRALADDAGVRATATTRIVALVGAPVSIYLAATHLAPRMQGFYFVAVNVIALAQLFEIGLGTIVVQFASHEWPKLRWDGGGLEGDRGARVAVRAILRAALRWYGGAALSLVTIAGVGGALLYGSSYGGSVPAFAVLWCTFVVLTALYLLVVPFVAVAEGCGDLIAVQRMRSWQAVALFLALWTGILTAGPLAAACFGAAAQLAVALVWLLLRHGALVRGARSASSLPDATIAGVAARYRMEQFRSAQLWLSLWLAPQLLTPIVLKLHGGDDAGRLGVTLAIALAPLTLALAWLHGRYPRLGALVAEARYREFDVLARRATIEAVAVLAAGAGALTGVVLLLPEIAPDVAARVLPFWSLLALFGGALASLLLQAMAGWLRAFRDEKISTPVVVGSLATVLVCVFAATVGGSSLVCVAYAVTGLGFAVPLATVHYLRVRRERL